MDAMFRLLIDEHLFRQRHPHRGENKENFPDENTSSVGLNSIARMDEKKKEKSNFAFVNKTKKRRECFTIKAGESLEFVPTTIFPVFSSLYEDEKR